MVRAFDEDARSGESGLVRQIVAGTTTVDWSQFEALAALRCTMGVAVPLLVGLAIGRPAVGVFGAIGAVSVGFGSFQGTYRSRAAAMLWAAVAMAVSLFVGDVAGRSIVAATIVTAAWGFGSGLLVALGPAASFVALQSAVAVVVAGGFPVDAAQALQHALLVLGGGLVQTLLVVIVWPLRRFATERRLIGRVYETLAAYAADVPREPAAFPDPATLAEAQSALLDPQPFARSREVAVFQALLDEAERIRASLVAVANHHGRLTARGATEAEAAHAAQTSDALIAHVARVLSAIAEAVREGRAPTAPPEWWRALEDGARRLRAETTAVDALLGQLRAAWRTAGVPASASEAEGEVELEADAYAEASADAAAGIINASSSSAAAVTAAAPTVGVPAPAERTRGDRRDPRVRVLPSLPSIKEGLQTLWANVSLGSTACRHALRLGVTLAVATAVTRVVGVQRGYWVSLTALLVLKPEFYETFTRAFARVAGTLLGAGCATLIAVFLQPGPPMLAALVLVCVWFGYALFRASYAVFTVCITGYVVFLITLSGIPEARTAIDRSLLTVIGGALAMLVYAVWPTWEGSQVRERIAALLEAQGRYVAMLLGTYVDPTRGDLDALNEARLAVRLARSNAEASVERMLIEPADRAPVEPRIARGLLAASRRHALATLALHAGLEHGPTRPVPVVAPLARQVGDSLATLAAAIRDAVDPPILPPLRETQLALTPGAPPLIVRETDLIVDSVNTMAALLSANGVRS